MKKITVHSINNMRKAHNLAVILRDKYHYNVGINIDDDCYKIISLSNDKWDDVVISIEKSEDNYNYLYIWEEGKEEMKLASNIGKYTNFIPISLPANDFFVNGLDAIYIRLELGKETSVEDIAKGIHSYLG